MRIDALKNKIYGRLAMVQLDAPLRAVASAMMKPDIGLVMVLGSTGSVTGVVTKSDLVRHLASGGAPTDRVEALMQPEVIVCGPADDLRITWQTMLHRHLQNMPVVSERGVPLGVLDIRDAMSALLEEEEFLEHELTNYIAGFGYR